MDKKKFHAFFKINEKSWPLGEFFEEKKQLYNSFISNICRHCTKFNRNRKIQYNINSELLLPWFIILEVDETISKNNLPQKIYFDNLDEEGNPDLDLSMKLYLYIQNIY